ncbi:MAG: hypothetical protein HC802_23270, partial [Caldilineaceae bacterium]|nr:hypothetical protein [Caldilineaceae bacterium]
EWLLVVNASMIEEDFAWLSAHGAEGVELRNASDEFAGLAVQGPRAADANPRTRARRPGHRHGPGVAGSGGRTAAGPDVQRLWRDD